MTTNEAAQQRAEQGYRRRFPGGALPCPDTSSPSSTEVENGERDPDRRKRTWVVYNGTEMGIFRDWLEAAFQITGFKGSLHRRYPCLEAAQLAWDRACKAGCVGPRKEWGVARARELVPGQQPVLFPEEIPGHSQLCALPKMWYTVVKGAYPGVYFGRLDAIQAMGVRGHCLWKKSTSQRDAVNEYLAQYRGGHVVQYLPGFPTTSTVNF